MFICKKNVIDILKYCFLTGLVVTVFSVSLSLAGNKKMVDEQVQELDEINKKAVGQIPGLPRDGVVEIKAKAFYEEGILKFNVYDKKVSETRVSETKEGTLDFGKKQQKTGKTEEKKNEPQENK